MKNILIIICAICLLSYKTHPQSKTIDKELAEAFNTIKNEVEIEEMHDTSVYRNNKNILVDFKYIKATNRIHWTTIEPVISKTSYEVIKYTVTCSNKKKIRFRKGDSRLKRSHPDYELITTTFIEDSKALKQYREEIHKEINNGEIITLENGKSIQIEDGLFLKLTGFVNKRVYPGQPLESRAYVQVTDGTAIKEVTFYDRSLEGVYYPNKVNYADYTFRLRKFSYSGSGNIEILVSKK